MISVHRNGVFGRRWCGRVAWYDDADGTIDRQGLEEALNLDRCVGRTALSEELVECLIEFLEGRVLDFEPVHHRWVVSVEELDNLE